MTYNAKEEIFCSVNVYCDNNASVAVGHALIGPLVCFVNFVYGAAAFQKNAVINFGIKTLGASMC